ncbi:hypothetical protein QNI16_36390 [Cytophagaceae bacterium YF14B1]|uniref:Uncharacterized protein n=1 Tax=Xanthocytophaga flava TaxID=3048013 RepID=A0AAE3UCZ4_9BACT|nr:hypothetical protein [Xanthocytophaga flavus]MDJ1486018.1 hypothetical protein [Xanthocytophaga flavus]
MILKTRTDQILTRPGMFSVTSSEELYWIFLGYCFGDGPIAKGLGVQSIVSDYGDFLCKQWNITLPHNRNWGILLRYYSQSDKDSLLLFQSTFDKFVEQAQFTYASPINEMGQPFALGNPDGKVSFLALLDEIQPKLDHIMQLTPFEVGYGMACYDYGKEDPEHRFFRQNTPEFYDSILTELHLPAGLNGIEQASWYFSRTDDSITYVLTKLRTFIQERKVEGTYS